MTEEEFEKVPKELRAVCLLRLLKRPVVRRWAARTFGFPAIGPLTAKQLAAWCGVHEDTIRTWEESAIISMRGTARRAGLTLEAVDELKNQ